MSDLCIPNSPRNLFALGTFRKFAVLFLGSAIALAGAIALSQEAPESVLPAAAAADANLVTIWSATSPSYQVCGWLPKKSTTEANSVCSASVTLVGPLPGGGFDPVTKPMMGPRSYPNSHTVDTYVYLLDVPATGSPMLLSYIKKDVVASTGITSTITPVKGSPFSLPWLSPDAECWLIPVIGSSNLLVITNLDIRAVLVNPTKPALLALLDLPDRSRPTTVTTDTLGHIALGWTDGAVSFYNSSGVALPLNLTAPTSTGYLADGTRESYIQGQTGWDINPNQPIAIE